MIRLMLVDDEFLIRELLKRRINWAQLGMEIVCEAASAHEALELVEQFEPDIIVTDICMPVMDGIELSRQILKKRPGMQIVVLTGHEEFEYAKRSINAGIADFLLKPINANEIERVALKIKAKLLEERNQRHELEALKQRLEVNLPFLREKFLHELIHQELELDDIQEALSYYGLNIHRDEANYQIAILESEFDHTAEANGEEAKLLLGMQCKAVICDYFHGRGSVHLFSEYDKRIVLLSNDAEVSLSECCEVIQSELIERFSCVVNIGIGTAVHELKYLQRSYNEASEALDYKIIVGKNQVVCYDELVFLAGGHAPMQPKGLDQLKFYIKTGLLEKADLLIEDLFTNVGPLQSGTLDAIRLLALDAVTAGLHALHELGIESSDGWIEQVQPFNSILKLDTLPAIKTYLKDFSLSMITYINGLNTKKVNLVVQQIKEYIQQYAEDASLSSSGIAKTFYLNQSHLSRLFKLETGQTVIEYMTRIRMEKAIELLKSTDLKVYQIGERVGIPDPHYFSIVFKKVTGKSVNNYRKTSL
ncbi:response regulator [Paenibacillus roseus]